MASRLLTKEETMRYQYYRAVQVAKREVDKAIRRGELTPMPCQICGDPKSVAHHQDYRRPLDVVWLCHKHHGQEHKRLRQSGKTVPYRVMGMVSDSG